MKIKSGSLIFYPWLLYNLGCLGEIRIVASTPSYTGRSQVQAYLQKENAQNIALKTKQSKKVYRKQWRKAESLRSRI